MTRRACLVCGRGFEVTGPRQSRCPEHAKPPVPRHRQYRKLGERLITAHPYCHLCGQPLPTPPTRPSSTTSPLEPTAAATTRPTSCPSTEAVTDAKAPRSGGEHDLPGGGRDRENDEGARTPSAQVARKIPESKFGPENKTGPRGVGVSGIYPRWDEGCS
jgi:hypothetical protein